MVTHLSLCKKGHWPTGAIANRVQLGVQPAYACRRWDGVKSPLLSRLAADRCALSCALSIITRSGGPLSAARLAKVRVEDAPCGAANERLQSVLGGHRPRSHPAIADDCGSHGLSRLTTMRFR